LALWLRPAGGTALVTLVHVLMRMLVLVAARRRCAAVLREGGYRRRQNQVGETSAEECTHRDSL
jgi:hypothetical protein